MDRRLIDSLMVMVVSVGALAFSPRLFAGELPKLEVGFGVTGISLPNYPGSSERRSYLLPFPFVIYRGERLRADRDGIRGLLFESQRMELDISIGGYIPVDSEDDPQRYGMPDLDSTLEVGPSLNLNLSDREARGPRLRIPLRAVISVGGSGDSHVGWRLHPVYELPLRERIAGFAAKFQIGPYIADSTYHDYYYSVADDEVRPRRPAFAARGGYGGLSLQVSATRRISGRWWLGAFARYDDLRSTVFEDSPLVVEKQALLFGVGLARIFYRSSSAGSQR